MTAPTAATAATAASAAEDHAELRALPDFDRALLLEATSETSANASIGDLNGDGNLDLVLVKGRHWRLISRIMLGDGKGGFPIAYDLGDIADRSYSGSLADMDGDGDLDIVISNDRPDAKRVHLNDGKGHFTPGSTFGDPEWQTRNASVADLNGDGAPDIVVANRSMEPANYICLNDGRGGFDAECVDFSHESATTITAADINGDGLMDLVVPNRDGGQSYIYIAAGNAEYPMQNRQSFGPEDAHIRMTAVADMNGDGRPDIVAIHEDAVVIYRSRASGGFDPGTALDNGDAHPYALTLSDLDGNGATDIIVGNVEAAATLFFASDSVDSADSNVALSFSKRHFGDSLGTVYGFAVADLDSDGQLDIVAGRSGAPNVVYFGSLGTPGK